MMNRKVLIFSLLCILSANRIFAQGATVEESIWSVQAGAFGVWVNNETRLSNVCTMRSEIELTGMYWNWYVAGVADLTSYAVFPLFRAEPRWYYNLQRRAAKGKNTIYNAADFFAVKTTVNPGLVLISKNVTVEPAFSIIPAWGFRRNFGRYFNFELSGGIGYVYTRSDGSDLGMDFTVRVGYVF
ncbi:MAG: hypothetical protein LBR49_04955 [Tannerella sp.]|jgi:hypothetical protein|nr:hypothetical protein [Tannerella sp.]